MFTAQEARAALPNARIARFEREIKEAVEAGRGFYYSYLRATPEDVEYLERHGYRVEISSTGTTWIYWH